MPTVKFLKTADEEEIYIHNMPADMVIAEDEAIIDKTITDQEYAALALPNKGKLLKEAFEAYQNYVYGTLSEVNPTESSFNALFQFKEQGLFPPENQADVNNLILAFTNFRTMVFMVFDAYEQQIDIGTKPPAFDYSSVPKPDIKFRYFKYLAGLEPTPAGWTVPDVSAYLPSNN